MDDDEFSPEGDDTPEAEAQAPVPGSNVNWEAEAKKAFAARDKARQELQRTKLEAKYGADLVGLIPTALPPKEWEEHAEKLLAFRAAAAPDQATPAPEDDSDSPTPDEIALAAATRGPSGQASPNTGMSPEDVLTLAKTDPQRYRQLRDSGAVSLERLPGADS